MDYATWKNRIREFAGIPRQLEGIRKTFERYAEIIGAANARHYGEDKPRHEKLEKLLAEREQSKGGQSHHETRQYRVQNSIRWATWLAFGAAAIYAAVAGYQLVELRRSIEVSNRAWIGVSRPVSITSIDSRGPEPVVTYVVTVKNYGPSVAQHLYPSAHIVTRAFDLLEQAHNSCKEAEMGSNGIMVNAGSKSAEHVIGDSMFPGDEYGRWFSGKFIAGDGFYIVGCVAYRDQFGKERHTQFCNWYQGTDLMKEKLPILMYSFLGLNQAD